jgi:predicted lipoprotein with Yx(FWY)xxD motif
MTRIQRLVAVALSTLVLAAAGPAHADALKVSKKEKIGSFITDAKGMTLYTFKKDSAGKSACEGPCVEKWPIYYAEKVDPMGDLKGADFGTITRADGKKQTTYKGMPLYYFAGDKAAGDTAGHGVKDAWDAAKP